MPHRGEPESAALGVASVPAVSGGSGGLSAGGAGTATGGRRERRRREVRDRLLETALELFLEQGYERTTMDEIANRADVARTTVFNHYPRKAEFLAEWAARRRDKVASGLRHNHVNEQPIGWILDHYMQLMAELNEESPAATKELMPAAIAFDNVLLKPPLAGTLAAYIRRAQRRGEVRADVDPNQAGLMLATTYFSTLINWCDPEPPAFDLRQALHGAVRLVLGGIESP